jgi:hypothetical protein
MTALETEEAVRALFFLQTSPVIAPRSYGGSDSPLGGHFELGRNVLGASAVSSARFESVRGGESGAPRHDDQDEDEEARATRYDAESLKPGSALLALLNLHRMCAFDASLLEGRSRSVSDDSSSDGSASCPAESPRSVSVALALEQLTRGRSLSVSTIDKRFSGEALSLSSPAPPLPVGKVGLYTREERRRIIDRFIKKRDHRIWRKRVKYDVRKSFADSRLRVKGRFVRKEDEDQLRELLVMSL